MKVYSAKNLTLALAFSALCVVPASANSIFHIGPGVSSSCPYGGCTPTDPNNIGTTELDVSLVSGGALKSPLNSVILLLAVPNDSTGTAITASELSVKSYSGNGTTISTLIPGSGTVTLDGFKPGFNSGDIFSFEGASGGNNSNSFVNFQATETSRLSSTPSSFGVYEFGISGITLGDKGAIDISFSSPLTNGTIAAAFAETCSTKRDVTTCSIKYDNAYTEAGFVDGRTPPRVPEPAGMALLGTGLSTIALRLRRK